MTPELDESSVRTNRRWLALAGYAALAVAVGFILYTQRPTGINGLPAEITVSQAASMREKGSFLLDVRQPEEWNESHIPGSTLIPLGELRARMGEVPRERYIVVVCRSGNRSRRARELLIDAGFKWVTSVAGGITAWSADGRPTVSGP